MRHACPRCDEVWHPGQPCPSCGFEPEHPGVLGSFAPALSTLKAHPGLLGAYLVPVLVLVAVQGVLALSGADQDVRDARVAAVSLAALFVHVWWYLIAVGGSVGPATGAGGPKAPEATVVAAAGLAAVLALAPWAALTGLVAWSPGGAAGAAVQLVVFVLLVATMVTAGRSLGVPVEAALGTGEPRLALQLGNRRARENGGLGYIFLLLLAIGTVLVAMAVLSVTGVLAVGTLAQFTAVSLVLWLLEAWVGVAAVHGLAGATGPERSLTCPWCGQEATAQAGRARCGSCGLEGPVHWG